MTRHTPGPWEAIGRGVYAASGREIIFGGHMTRTAEEEEQRANASLIASAPDLLTALEMAVATIERIAPKHGPFSSVDGTLSVARAALARAEGRG